LWLQDFRGWLKTEFNHKMLTIYARGRYYHSENRTSEDYTGEQDDLYGPYLDMLYATFNLSRKGVPFKTTVGRQYVKLGRGIVYSDVHDGIKIEADLPLNLSLKTFGVRTKPHDANLDYSAPQYKKEHKRFFWGTELAYRGIKNNVLYGYTLLQRDRSLVEPQERQKYRYNSQYYGLGASGEPVKDGKYWVEIIKEYGNTYCDILQTNREKCGIDAWAYNAGGKYRLDMTTHPTFEIETAFGSGDSDRERVTNTLRGNALGDDNNFLYYGTYAAGYAFMPRLSNMFIYKAGFSMVPFEKAKILNLNQLGVGAKYYLYHKHKKDGGIYDVEATEEERFLGTEIDLFIYWKAYHNCYSSVRYGVFYPGDAYPAGNQEKSEYFLARMTILF